MNDSARYMNNYL